ncbi:MAG: hypothetical protein ACI4GV_04170 [Acutalibacteraceae bacterium]
MEKYVPFCKMSKKQQKEINRQKRTVWNVNPITRKTENKKIYNRKKSRLNDYYNNSGGIF